MADCGVTTACWQSMNRTCDTAPQSKLLRSYRCSLFIWVYNPGFPFWFYRQGLKNNFATSDLSLKHRFCPFRPVENESTCWLADPANQLHRRRQNQAPPETFTALITSCLTTALPRVLWPYTCPAPAPTEWGHDLPFLFHLYFVIKLDFMRSKSKLRFKSNTIKRVYFFLPYWNQACVSIAPRTCPSVWPVRRNTSLWRRNHTSLWAWLLQEGGAARAGSCRSLWRASNRTAACRGMGESKEVNASSGPIEPQPKHHIRKPLHLLASSLRWCAAEHQRAGFDLPEPQWGRGHLEGQRCVALGPAASARGQHGGRAGPWWAAASHSRQWLWCQLVPLVGHVAGPAQVSTQRKYNIVLDVWLCFVIWWCCQQLQTGHYTRKKSLYLH